MSDRALTRSEKTSSYLVTFTFGDPASPDTARYTDWTAPVSLFGNGYASVPTMEIELAPNTAGLSEQPTGITLPINSFAARISLGEPHSIVQVEIRELIQARTDGHAPIVFAGKVQLARRNHQGIAGAVRLECVSVKQELKVPLGIPATHLCAWTFGDANCGINKLTLSQTLQITAIAGATVTLDASIVTGTHWLRGYAEFEGIRLGIRDYAGGSDVVLTRPPPRDWIEKSVLLVPGCTKEIEVCRSPWANEDNFMGCGYAIPEYHPLIEGR